MTELKWQSFIYHEGIVFHLFLFTVFFPQGHSHCDPGKTFALHVARILISFLRWWRLASWAFSVQDPWAFHNQMNFRNYQHDICSYTPYRHTPHTLTHTYAHTRASLVVRVVKNRLPTQETPAWSPPQRLMSWGFTSPRNFQSLQSGPSRSSRTQSSPACPWDSGSSQVCLHPSGLKTPSKEPCLWCLVFRLQLAAGC